MLDVTVDESEAVDAIDAMRIFRFRVKLPNWTCIEFTFQDVLVEVNNHFRLSLVLHFICVHCIDFHKFLKAIYQKKKLPVWH